MTEEIAVAESDCATVALAWGKTGVYASVNGQKPVRLPKQPAKPVTATSLLAALRPFTTKHLSDDLKVDVILIGTRAEGKPGWDGVDIAEANSGAPNTVRFTELSEAQVLHKSFRQSSAPKGSNAFLVFATATQPDQTEPVGSVRCWVEDSEGGVNIEDVYYCDSCPSGKIFTILGGSIITTASMVASLVESLLAHYPGVTRVFIWSQDGMKQYPHYAKGGGFWGFLRLPQAFTDAGGEIVIVDTALSIVSLASTMPAK